jgi:hypothetical protein
MAKVFTLHQKSDINYTYIDIILDVTLKTVKCTQQFAAPCLLFRKTRREWKRKYATFLYIFILVSHFL